MAQGTGCEAASARHNLDWRGLIAVYAMEGTRDTAAALFVVHGAWGKVCYGAVSGCECLTLWFIVVSGMSAQFILLKDVPRPLSSALKIAAEQRGKTMREYVLCVLRDAVIDAQEQSATKLYESEEEITPTPKAKKPMFR